MEKTPSPFSSLPSGLISLSLSGTRMGPPFTSPLSPLRFLSPRLVEPSRCLYLAFSPGVGWIFSRLAFLHSPYPETKVPEPAQAREAFGGPAAPASWVPSVLRFVSCLVPFLRTSMHRIAREYASPKVASFAKIAHDRLRS